MSHGNWNEGLISSKTILSLLLTLTVKEDQRIL